MPTSDYHELAEGLAGSIYERDISLGEHRGVRVEPSTGLVFIHNSHPYKTPLGLRDDETRRILFRLTADNIAKLAYASWPPEGEESAGYTYVMIMNCCRDDQHVVWRAFEEMTRRSHWMFEFGDRTPIRLLSHHPILLMNEEDEGRRFVQLFRKAWRRIPTGARRTILAHWRSHRSWDSIDVLPWIQLQDYGQKRTWGSCVPGGHALRFNQQVVEIMPEECVQVLIAHELAHVFQFACGLQQGMPRADGTIVYFDTQGPWSAGAVEDDADDLVMTWGSDVAIQSEWAVEVGITARSPTNTEELAEMEAYRDRTGDWPT